MKLFFTAFSIHNPFSSGLTQEHNVFPIATESERGLDLDYSSILVAEKFVIDRTAFDFVRERKDRHLGPMFESLRIFEDEGLLEVQDYAQITKPYAAKISSKAEELLEDIDPWLPIAKRQWRVLRPELEEFQKLYGVKGREMLDVSHFGVINYLHKRDGHIDHDEWSRLHDLINKPERGLKKTDKAELREILKPLVAQVVMNDLIRKKLGIPLIDWDDAEGFYRHLYLGQWNELDSGGFPSLQIAEYARNLFNLVIPELRPNSAREVVKFLHKRRAVRSLREELWQLFATGQPVSKDWMVSLFSEVTKARLKTEKRNRLIKWVGRAAGLLVPGANIVGDHIGPLFEASADIIIDASEATTEGILNRRHTARFEWFYALQNLHLDREK